MTSTILLIDDDNRLAALLKPFLQGAGFIVTHKETLKAGLTALKQSKFDLILLDLMLPDGDGFDFFKTLRQTDATPVVMLTAKGETMDKIIGLELGADDYIAKPFEPRELIARIKAVLRRGTAKHETHHKAHTLELDENERTLKVAGEIKPLTAYQFDLLLVLMKRAGRVMSREQLADLVRGQEASYDPAFDRSIDIHIGKIRAQIEQDPKNPQLLMTIRSVGYVFKKDKS
jgi:DNA-binding response OmpR family regulator